MFSSCFHLSRYFFHNPPFSFVFLIPTNGRFLYVIFLFLVITLHLLSHSNVPFPLHYFPSLLLTPSSFSLSFPPSLPLPSPPPPFLQFSSPSAENLKERKSASTAPSPTTHPAPNPYPGERGKPHDTRHLPHASPPRCNEGLHRGTEKRRKNHSLYVVFMARTHFSVARKYSLGDGEASIMRRISGLSLLIMMAVGEVLIVLTRCW